MRWLGIVVGVAVLGGCGSEVVTAPDQVACGGTLGGEPRVLADGLGDGYLLVDGSDLIHVEIYQSALVRRIDGCDGTIEELGQFEETIGAVLWGDSIHSYQIAEVGYQIWRLPLAGGDAEFVTSVGSVKAMVAHAEGLYVYGAADGEPDRSVVRRLEGEELVPGLSIADGEIEMNRRVVGVSEAGVYFTESYDCGCTPTLRRWPFTGDELVGVKGTEGARRPSVVDGALIVARDSEPVGFGSGRYEIARVPLDGGEGEVLVETREGLDPFRGWVTSDRLGCWSTFEGAPRCLRFDEGEIVSLGEGPKESLVVIGDVAYWTRPMKDAARFELVAAVP